MKRSVLVLALLLPAVSGWVQAQSTAQRASALFDEYWQYQLRENPLLATSAGDHRYNDRLPSLTIQDITRRTGAYRELLTRLNQLRVSDLSASDRISYDMM